VYPKVTFRRRTIHRPSYRPLVAGLLVSATWHASAEPGWAQEAVACEGGRIVEITIDNHSVFDLSDPDNRGRLGWAYRLANSLHIQTRSDVVERELLFEVGDCYDIDLLRDSERLLRAFPFIADANIYGVHLGDERYQVVVDTQDEWSTRIEPRVGSPGFAGLDGLRVVEDNLVGTGRHLALYVDREDEERIFGASYATPHLFRTRWNMALQLARTEAGYSFRESITYPFVGEVGRVAFRQVASRQNRNFELLMPNGGDELSRIRVPVLREQYEIGAAFRWGEQRYRHTMIGSSLVVERIGYPSDPTFEDDDAALIVDDPPERMDWNPVSSVRLMLLTGQRNVYFIRSHGVDTVNGTEDVQLGVEAEASFGPTLPVLSEDRDIAVGLGLFAAGELTDRIIAGGTFSFEGRRGYKSLPGLPEWNDVVGELDLWAYYRRGPDSRHQIVGAFTALGGWHGRTPFQLTLGGYAGMRGYPRHVDPGGRRVVASLEHRANLNWPLPELFDLGSVLFLDVGRIWAGHAPFGTGSPIRASVGGGIRAAFPPGSLQTFRLDVGVPVEGHLGFRNVTVTIGVGQAIGRRAVRRDPQLVRSARYGLGTVDFLYPDGRR
jgi:hypothetical protein